MRGSQRQKERVDMAAQSKAKFQRRAECVLANVKPKVTGRYDEDQNSRGFQGTKELWEIRERERKKQVL